MEPTVAESLLLIALDDTKGSAGSTPLDPGLAGALASALAAAAGS